MIFFSYVRYRNNSPHPRCTMWIIHTSILTCGTCTKGWRGTDMYFVYRRLYGELVLIFLLHFNWSSISFYICTHLYIITVSPHVPSCSHWWNSQSLSFMIGVSVWFGASVYFLQVQLVNTALLSHALYIRFQVKRHDSVRAFNYICK